jgi:hypothetical protein
MFCAPIVLTATATCYVAVTLTYIRFAQQSNTKVMGVSVPQIAIHPYRVYQISTRLAEQVSFYIGTVCPIAIDYSWRLLTRKRTDEQSILYTLALIRI